MDLTPVTLKGRYLTLEPLEERHAPDLFDAMQDEEVCRYLAWPPPGALEETLALVRDARALRARGQSLPFAQVWNETGRAIGSTRLLDIRPADRQVEIGSTFLARRYWRTPASGALSGAARVMPPERARELDWLEPLLDYGRVPERFNTVSVLIDRHLAAGRGARLAILTPDATVSYADLARGVDRAARVLVELGAAREQRVALLLPDSPAFAYVFFGAMKAGLVPVPISTFATPFKVPRWITLVDALPKTATGKVQRYRLRTS